MFIIFVSPTSFLSFIPSPPSLCHLPSLSFFSIPFLYLSSLSLPPLPSLPFPQGSTCDDVIKSLLEAGMIPVLVKLASRPTHINKKWYLTDLEVRHHMTVT